MIKSTLKNLTLAILALSFVTACSSTKKKGDSTAQGNPPSVIETSPMNFDATGSDSGKINGLLTVNFEYDKSVLSSEMKDKLTKNADWIKKNANVNLQIEGHCDVRGSIEYNLALGERRAKAVKDYLVGLGISNARLSVISYGKEKLLTNGETEADHAKNRRANFLPLAQ